MQSTLSVNARRFLVAVLIAVTCLGASLSYRAVVSTSMTQDRIVAEGNTPWD